MKKPTISKSYEDWMKEGLLHGFVPSDGKLKLDNGGNIKSSLGVVDGEIPTEAVDLNSLTSKSELATDVAKAPIPYAQIGSILGEVVEGNNNLLENRSADKNRSVAGGALKGAGTGAATGAMIGSVVPGIGTAIGAVGGAVIGGISGGIKGKNAYDQGADNLNQYLTDRNSGMTRDQVTMFAAYGAELPEMSMGGDPVEFNGNTHDNGGISLGSNVEVEDGEVQVGNYVFSNRLVSEKTGRTFAAEAKRITDKFKEYENDGPSMKTQQKMLEAIKAENDSAREIQEAKDEAMAVEMEGDYAAYGAMINKNQKGEYVIDKMHKPLLMEAAKLKGVGYNSYIDNMHAYGGMLKKKMALGGDKDKDFLPGDPNYTQNPDSNLIDLQTRSAQSLFQDQYGDMTSDYSKSIKNTNLDPINLPVMDARNFNTNPNIDRIPSGLNGDNYDRITMNTRSANQIPDNIDRTPLPANYQQKTSSGYTTYPGLEDDILANDTKKVDLNKLDNAALLAATLPDIQNMIRAQRKSDTTFDRLQLNDIDLNQERASLKSAIANARAAHDANVRGTASSSGDALAALSAGNAELASQESSGMARIDSEERNYNTQMRNRQAEMNLNLSNQEMVARQQDEAMRAGVTNRAIANMGENTGTYLRDKKLDVKNQDYNTMIKSLMDTGEYMMIPDNKGGFQILHKASQKTKTK